MSPNPPAPNAAGLGEFAAVLSMPDQQVLAVAASAASSYRRTGWELAFALVEIEARRLYAPTYRSVTGYGKGQLGMSSSQVCKHWQAGRALLAMPPEQRPAILAVGPTTAYETGLLRLVKRAPVTAAKLAARGETQRELRRTVERIAPKAKSLPPPRLDAIAAGPDGLRWSLVVLSGVPPVYRLEVAGRQGRLGRPTTQERAFDLDAAGVAEELLRLADAIGVRGLLEARLRRHAA